MGYQAETAVILEFIWLVQTCFHRHFLTRLPLIRANFFSIQPLTIRAGRTPALRGQKGGHCTHRHLASQIWRRNVANLCRICERFKAIYCASQNFFNFDRYDSKTTVTQTPQGTRPKVCWCLLTNRVAMPTCARQARDAANGSSLGKSRNAASRMLARNAVVSKRQQTLQAARTCGNFEVPGEAAWVRPPNLQRVAASSCWTLATVRGQGLPA